jgi:hypothetical protein
MNCYYNDRRKTMTFSIPASIAKVFEERMKAEEIALARACDIANSDEDVHSVEQEFRRHFRRHRGALDRCPRAVN